MIDDAGIGQLSACNQQAARERRQLQGYSSRIRASVDCSGIAGQGMGAHVVDVIDCCSTDAPQQPMQPRRDLMSYSGCHVLLDREYRLRFRSRVGKAVVPVLRASPLRHKFPVLLRRHRRQLPCPLKYIRSCQMAANNRMVPQDILLYHC